MKKFMPISSAFILALALPALAADTRGNAIAPTDEKAAEADTFMNAKLIAIRRENIEVRDKDGQKRTLALDADATVEDSVKPGSDVILAIKDKGDRSEVVSVKSTGSPAKKGSTVVYTLPKRTVAGAVEPATPAYSSGLVAVPPPNSEPAVSLGYGGVVLDSSGGTTALPAPITTAGSPDAAALQADPAIRAYDASLARIATKAVQAERAFGRYTGACGKLRTTVTTSDREQLSTALNSTANETGDPCDPLLTSATGLGHEVQQELAAADDAARRAGVLPGVMRQLRTLHGLDWSGWDR